MSIEKVIETINKKLDKEIEKFNSDFEKVMKRIEFLSLSVIDTDPLTFDKTFNDILQKSGYFDLINRFINESYDKTYNEIKKAFEEGGILITFDKEDLKKIEALKKLDYTYFIDLATATGKQLKSDLYKYTLSNLSKEEMIQNISLSLQNTNLAKYSYTYAETSISKFNQSIIDMKSATTDKGVWVYVGVNDNATRSFCKCLLEQHKYYDDEDKNLIQNDKRRQWNCRHILLKIDENEAKKDGYKKGAFSC